MHGTTAAPPSRGLCRRGSALPAPGPLFPYDLPIYANPKVHRDHYIEVARALYSVPGNLIGQRVEARADRALVRVYSRGTLVKTHPRQAPGGRSTDPADFPAEKTIYAIRDLDRLQGLAASHGPAIGAYAKVILDDPLPWRKMRQVYALLGLVKKWGAEQSRGCVRESGRRRSFQRRPYRPHARAGDRGTRHPGPAQAVVAPRSFCPSGRTVRHQEAKASALG